MAKRILRPMGCVEILDEVFDLYKQNFLVVIAITAIVEAIAHLAMYDVRGESRGLMSYWLVYPLTSLSSGAIVYAISASFLQSRPTVTSAYRAVLPKSLRLIITGVLAAAASLVGLVFLIVPGAVVYVYLAFAYQVVVLEDLAYVPALRRSFSLVRGQWIRVFVVMALTALITLLIYAGITSGAVYLSTGKWATFVGGQGYFPVVIGFFAATLTSPIFAIASVLIYYDIRVRKEGFDLELLAKEMKVGLPSSAKTTAS